LAVNLKVANQFFQNLNMVR